ncbi:MAG: thioredoxin domain-containing protein [Ferruginibacter sp.]
MRLKHLIIGLAVILTNSSCGQTGNKKTDEEKQSFSNHLVHESSPYLLMHAHNPVDWYPWGQEAFDKAKKENKPVIISIGYAACHWCHVMERESYSDTAVARLMNENFVAIKVDREERPDVDQVYMNAAQLLNGNGGWPLNAIALPDGRPLYAATYFPKNEWM